ncbi:MAG: peptide chain release factor N(5)-glutamine methyltransferase [Patescibacteria group bacterium]
MTIKQAITIGTEKLRQKQIDQPSLEAELLLAKILKKDRVFILTNDKKNLTIKQNLHYRYLINLKTKNWPTAYLLGQQEFFGLDFKVNKHTLIPRPETELLVESALKLIPNKDPITIIEVGTGSGCIIISVADNNTNQEANYIAIEISKKAIKMARLNAENHHLNQKIKFIKGGLLSPIIKQQFSDPVMILANLPYLTPNQFKSSLSIQREPQSALISGNDGLDLYRQMLKQAKGLKAPKLTLIIEIDPAQTSTIKELACNNWPQAKTEVLKDLRGQDRIIIIEALK